MYAFYAFKYFKDKDILLEVLKQKPDLNIQNYYGDTIAMFAFQYCKDKEILLEVLKQKPDLNIQTNYGWTLVLYAFYNCKNKDVLLEILKQKPDLNLRSCNNTSVVMYAFKFCKYKDVLLEVLKQKPDLTLIDKFKYTAFDYALDYYTKSHEFEFDILEKLYCKQSKQNKQLFNSEYIKIRNKYKVLPLILFRYKKKILY